MIPNSCRRTPMANEIVVIGQATLDLLARGIPVSVNGGRVILIDASDFPRAATQVLRTEVPPASTSAANAPSAPQQEPNGE
jgi:hypothetical protein